MGRRTKEGERKGKGGTGIKKIKRNGRKTIDTKLCKGKEKDWREESRVGKKRCNTHRHKFPMMNMTLCRSKV